MEETRTNLHKITLKDDPSEIRNASGSLNNNNNTEAEQLKLVIFDKDGTLVNFHKMWAPWCDLLCEKLEEQIGSPLSDELFAILNYDPDTRKIGKGSLAENTHELLKQEVAEMLCEKFTIPVSKARTVVDKAWKSVNSSNVSMQSTVEPFGDVEALFRQIRSLGLKIAVCTSDSRTQTLLALNHLDLSDLVDRVMCGDDSDNVPKPAPANVHIICSEFNVKPENTAVIGDTPADIQMGSSSNSKLVVGVLSGVCTKEDLDSDANVVVDSIQDILPFISALL